jgi:MFS family permease
MSGKGVEEKKCSCAGSDAAPDKIWNESFTGIFIASMIMYLGQQMMNTLVAKYTYHLGGAPLVVGIVTSSFAYTALLFKVFAAPAIDVLNKKYVLAGAMLVMAASYAGYSLSASVPPLLCSRLFQGAGQAFSATCALALVADTLPQNKLGLGISYFSLAQVICQSIGPSLGLFLSETFGYRAAFMTGAVTMVFAAFMAGRIKTNFKQTKKYRITLNNIIAKEAVLPGLIMFLLCMAYYNITAFLVIYAAERGVGNYIGSFFTVYAVTLLFTRPIIGKLGDKYGLASVLIPAMCFFALAFMLISFAASLWVFLLAAFISSFGYGACQPAVQTLCMKIVPKEKRGAGSSTNYIGQDLGNLVGPVIAGMVTGHFGYPVMWRVMIIPVIAALVIVIVFRGKINRASGKTETQKE